MVFLISSRFTDLSIKILLFCRVLPTKDPQCFPSCKKLHYYSRTPVSDEASTKCITLCPTQDTRTEPTTSNTAVKHPTQSGIQVAKNNCLFSGACFLYPFLHCILTALRLTAHHCRQKRRSQTAFRLNYTKFEISVKQHNIPAVLLLWLGWEGETDCPSQVY